jgi:hypothetical protein
MRQITLSQLLLVNVIIDVYGLVASVSSQLFDKISGHSRPEQMSYEPMAATMGLKPLIQLVGSRIMHVFDVPHIISSMFLFMILVPVFDMKE